MRKQKSVQKDLQVILTYSSTAASIAKGFDKALSSLAQVETHEYDLPPRSRRVEKGISALLGPLPIWIELVLIFASTTIATSILNKFGEDTYNFFKNKLK